jgi:hypothetical protein
MKYYGREVLLEEKKLEFIGAETMVSGTPFLGFVEGEFVDALGRPVTVSGKDIETYLANTLALIKDTVDNSGKITGIPIDALNHERGNAAGWITDVSMGERNGRKGIIFHPIWTKLGVELVGGGLQKFFSATFDDENVVVVGGTLTNYPASRDEKRHIVNEPITLTEADDNEGELYAKVEKMFMGMLNKLFNRKAKPKPKKGVFMDNDLKVPKTIDELIQLLGENEDEGGQQISIDLAEMVDSAATEKAKVLLKESLAETERKAKVSSLVKEMTEGEGEAAFALGVNPKDLEAFLLSMDEDQFSLAVTTLTQIKEKGIIDFSENGSNDKGKGDKTPLPDYVQMKLRNKELELSDLSNPILGLGDLKEYDLAEWEKEGK